MKTLKSQAEKWRTIDIPENNTFYSFKTAYNRLLNYQQCYVHNNCVICLRTKLKSYEPKFPKVSVLAQQYSHVEEETYNENSSESHCTRSFLSSSSTNDNRCFVCNNDATNTQRVSRISQNSRAEHALNAMRLYLNEPNSSYYSSAKRLDVILQGSSDIFAANVYYHNVCFQSFSRISQKPEENPMEDLVLSYFSNYIKLKICK